MRVLTGSIATEDAAAQIVADTAALSTEASFEIHEVI